MTQTVCATCGGVMNEGRCERCAASVPPPLPPSLPQSSPSTLPVGLPVTSQSSMSGRDAYNLATDTIAGPNIRLTDNLYQAAAIVVSLLLGVGIGAMFTRDAGTGATIGGVIGLVGGLLVSGIVIMIVGGVRHARGKHD